MAALPGYQGGYCVRSANYFQPVTMQNNYGPLSTVFDSPQRIAFMASGISGLADVEIDTGTTYSTQFDSHMEIISQSSGSMRINMPNDGELTRFLNWSGTRPTKFKVTRVGITGDTAPEWIAGMEDAEIIRDLDMGLQNFLMPVGPNFARNTPASGFYLNDTGVGPNLPYQDISNGIRDYANAKPNFKTYWSVLGVDTTDAYITAKATYERDTIPSRIHIVLEWGNELHWNGALPGTVFEQLEAIRRGYYNDPPYNAPNAPIAVNTDFGGSPAGSVSPSAVTAGSYVLYNAYGVGNKIYRVKQNAPAGTVVVDSIASTSNAYFERQTWELGDSGRQWAAVRFNQIIEIYRSVFGETRFQSQIFPVIMRQAGGLIGAVDIEQNYVPGFWAKIKGAGSNFYAYQQDSLDVSDGSGVTAAQLEASFRARLQEMKTSVTKIVADAAILGKVPCFYEGGSHTMGPYQGTNGTNAYTLAWNGMFKGDLGRAFLRDIAYFMKTTVPGLVVMYDLVGQDPWSLKLKWSDTGNKRLIGWKEGLALVDGPPPVDPPPVDPPPVDPPPVDPPPVTLPTIDRGGAILHQYRDVLGCAPVVCLIAVGIGVARAIV